MLSFPLSSSCCVHCLLRIPFWKYSVPRLSNVNSSSVIELVMDIFHSHTAYSYSLNTVLFLFSYLFSFTCCTKFLDIFFWYVTIGQTKYHLSTKDLKSIKLEYYNSIKILTALGSLKQFKQMGSKV